MNSSRHPFGRPSCTAKKIICFFQLLRRSPKSSVASFQRCWAPVANISRPTSVRIHLNIYSYWCVCTMCTRSKHDPPHSIWLSPISFGNSSTIIASVCVCAFLTVPSSHSQEMWPGLMCVSNNHWKRNRIKLVDCRFLSPTIHQSKTLHDFASVCRVKRRHSICDRHRCTFHRCWLISSRFY